MIGKPVTREGFFCAAGTCNSITGRMVIAGCRSGYALRKLLELLESFNLKEIIVTDSILQSAAFRSPHFLSVRSLSDKFGRVINPIHYNQSVNDLFYKT